MPNQATAQQRIKPFRVKEVAALLDVEPATV